jgi:hypothetical protein
VASIRVRGSKTSIFSRRLMAKVARDKWIVQIRAAHRPSASAVRIF